MGHVLRGAFGYFEAPSAEISPLEHLDRWPLPKEVIDPKNDGIEVFALPPRLTRALAGASSADLGEPAERCTTRLRAADGDDTTAMASRRSGRKVPGSRRRR
ncbi:hypothetical protein [Streptomyces sp. NPDC102487]|uniref:hypothetical protein n=1 Tax=Streptomyces sp. NPDC102487 TaxID=3366182 RepID=UPI00381B844A